MYYISHCMRVPKAYSRHEQFQNGCVHSCRLYPCSFSLVFLFTDRIPRNHVGASRIAHVCFASPFLFLSLSPFPLLFLSQSFYFFARFTPRADEDGRRTRPCHSRIPPMLDYRRAQCSD